MTKIQELYKRVAGDFALQEKFNQIIENGQKDGREATEQKLLQFAKAEGYEISLEEMQAFFQGMATQAEGELSDTELDQVAGGKVQVDKVLSSVFSAGVICALGSIIFAIRSSCEDFFHEESTYDGM